MNLQTQNTKVGIGYTYEKNKRGRTIQTLGTHPFFFFQIQARQNKKLKTLLFPFALVYPRWTKQNTKKKENFLLLVNWRKPTKEALFSLFFSLFFLLSKLLTLGPSSLRLFVAKSGGIPVTWWRVKPAEHGLVQGAARVHDSSSKV